MILVIQKKKLGPEACDEVGDFGANEWVQTTEGRLKKKLKKRHLVVSVFCPNFFKVALTHETFKACLACTTQGDRRDW